MRIAAKWMVPALGLALLATACEDKTGPDEEDEPDVATIQLLIGTQTVSINTGNGVVTGGPINLALNSSSLVTATFLRANGTADPIVTPTDFELRVEQATTGITFTRTGPFAGTLRGTTAGNGSAKFILYSTDHGHPEYEYVVPITVASVNQ